MTTVLVTGGAGYIGSHTCKALAQAGYTPVVYDSMEHGHEWAVKWGPLEEGDIADRQRLDAVLNTYKPQAVMHFAGYISVGESVEKPDKYYHNNVKGSRVLLEAIRDHGVQKVVFSSSAAVYGIPAEAPIREDHPLNPVNPYGETKLAVEQMLQEYHENHQLGSISLRYFNAAGADPDGEIGEAHEPETHLIPLVLEAAAGRRPHIEIYGNDYDTPDGTCIRDYIHVSDLAAAHVLALKALEAAPQCTACNLGNGRGFSVKEVITTAQKVTGIAIPVKAGPRRAGDPATLLADADRAKATLGWQPEHTALDTIIQSAWHWSLHAAA
jgi:UDP-arabinose 4-epimerase